MTFPIQVLTPIIKPLSWFGILILLKTSGTSGEWFPHRYRPEWFLVVTELSYTENVCQKHLNKHIQHGNWNWTPTRKQTYNHGLIQIFPELWLQEAVFEKSTKQPQPRVLGLSHRPNVNNRMASCASRWCEASTGAQLQSCDQSSLRFSVDFGRCCFNVGSVFSPWICGDLLKGSFFHRIKVDEECRNIRAKQKNVAKHVFLSWS